MGIVIKTYEIHKIRENSKIFFDTNIWMFIFCEIGSYKKYFVDEYSSAYKKILKTSHLIFIDIMVLSEFVNRYLHIAHSNYTKQNNLKIKDCEYKKDYRKTDDFKEAWENVCNIVKNNILPHTNVANFQYNGASLETLFDDDSFDTDFNDNHIINLCLKNNIYLLTNDKDFKNAGINIITENRRYWKS